MKIQDQCVWCKKRPRLGGLALCKECHELQESDEGRITDQDYHFRCPECGKDIGGRIICPECGVVRMLLMSLPWHCKRCHSQFSYDAPDGISRCWACKHPFGGAGIDDYIMFAIQNFDAYKTWKNRHLRQTVKEEKT